MSLIRLAFRLFLGKRLARTSGRVVARGLRAPITIRRDKYGIPAVEAANDDDAFFGMGFVHAQDRGFQLELLRRVAGGEVADFAGPPALPLDRLSRRIGFARAAREQYSRLDADVKASLDAYSRGVAAGYAASPVPHEFSLLGIKSGGWQPSDTLAVTKLLSFTLASNWDSELVRLKVYKADGPEALAALDPTYPAWHPVIQPTGGVAGTPAADRLAEDLERFFAWVGHGGGSNNWVVAPSRTKTGRPILCNDPHLDPSLPAHWYLCSVRTPDWAMAGASFVGGPVVLSGHNEHAAWGLTAGLADNTDLFLEELNAAGDSVRDAEGDGYSMCPAVEETIAVKGAPPHVERVMLTPRGPIVSPALSETPQALSLRAVWLDPHPVTGFFRMHRVRTYDEFRAAFEHWPMTSQAVVFADRSGSIGWQLIGRTPVRKAGHGAFPLAGSDPGVGWEDGLWPYDEMPHGSNPPQGYIATANTRHTPEGEGAFLGVDFIDGYRASAINAALAAKSDWDIAESQKLLSQQVTFAWREIRDTVLATTAGDDFTRKALDLLRPWDGTLSDTSAAGSVYELFVADMVCRVARAKAPESWKWVVGAALSPITPFNFGCYRRISHLSRLLRERPDGWFPDGWEPEIANALGVAVNTLSAKFGDDPKAWGWGNIRPLVMRHPLSKSPGMLGKALATIFNLGPVPMGGDCDVINQAAALPTDPLAPTNNIASMRSAIDVGAWANSRFSLPAGQSGNPFSPHYADLFALWRKGDGVPVAFTAEEARNTAVATLEVGVAAAGG